LTTIAILLIASVGYFSTAMKQSSKKVKPLLIDGDLDRNELRVVDLVADGVDAIPNESKLDFDASNFSAFGSMIAPIKTYPFEITIGGISGFMRKVFLKHPVVALVLNSTEGLSRLNIMLDIFCQFVSYSFFDALILSILSGDDGKCQQLANQRFCIYFQEISAIDNGKSKCRWDMRTRTCQFRYPEFTVFSEYTIFVFAAMASLPIIIFIKYLIFVISSETIRGKADVKKNKVATFAESITIIMNESEESKIQPPTTNFVNSNLFRSIYQELLRSDVEQDALSLINSIRLHSLNLNGEEKKIFNGKFISNYLIHSLTGLL
jgi:hypothetical protein